MKISIKLHSFIKHIKHELKTKSISIVFPEGDNNEVIKAADKLKVDGIIKPILITKDKYPAKGFVSINDKKLKEELAKELFEVRKDKGVTREEANKLIEQPNYFATMLVKTNKADGYVGGIDYTTAETLRPALQIIKTDKKSTLASSVFVMIKNNDILIFTDSAINIDPTPKQLKEIALKAITFAKDVAGFSDVRTALLSYATADSATGSSAEKVTETLKLLSEEKLKNTSIYGPIQFDAAFAKEVMKKKAPWLKWKDKANVYVFPDLQSANISYKVAERMGKYFAIGPIVLGLNKPVNDLSRGASYHDIVDVAYITALQALRRNNG